MCVAYSYRGHEGSSRKRRKVYGREGSGGEFFSFFFTRDFAQCLTDSILQSSHGAAEKASKVRILSGAAADDTTGNLFPFSSYLCYLQMASETTKKADESTDEKR